MSSGFLNNFQRQPVIYALLICVALFMLWFVMCLVDRNKVLAARKAQGTNATRIKTSWYVRNGKEITARTEHKAKRVLATVEEANANLDLVHSGQPGRTTQKWQYRYVFDPVPEAAEPKAADPNAAESEAVVKEESSRSPPPKYTVDPSKAVESKAAKHKEEKKTAQSSKSKKGVCQRFIR